MEAINYAKKSNKEKRLHLLNTATLVIVIFIALLILFNNIRNELYFHSKYSQVSVEETVLAIDKINKNINLILNNQGKYTDEEYNEIKKYFSDILTINDFEKGQKIIEKDYLTFTDIKQAIDYNIFTLSIDNVIPYESKIYEIILSYDSSKINNLITYTSSRLYLLNTHTYIQDFIKEHYSYNGSIKDDAGMALLGFIGNKYQIFKQISNLVIEVGDIHE